MQDPSASATRRFQPTATWEALKQRADFLQRMRRFFSHRGFLEVETPLLSSDTVVDTHLEPFAVVEDDARGANRWLQTSPEFGMKRLLAAGAEKIFQITRAFRQAEYGPLHNPEFTMVEWYRVGDDMQAGVALLGELAQEFLQAPRVEVAHYGDVVRAAAGVDPFEASDSDLREMASRCGLVRSARATRDDCLDVIFSTHVAPRLGRDAPLIVTHFPASQAAMARLDPTDPRCAERFELFAQGVELANGYHELTDADEWRRRATEANRQRQQGGRPVLPVESRLMAAMEAGLPPCSGTALGFDRLLMVALGCQQLAEVLAFPWDIA